MPADTIWSCPWCGTDLTDWWCPACETLHSPAFLATHTDPPETP